MLGRVEARNGTEPQVQSQRRWSELGNNHIMFPKDCLSKPCFVLYVGVRIELKDERFIFISDTRKFQKTVGKKPLVSQQIRSFYIESKHKTVNKGLAWNRNIYCWYMERWYLAK